MNLKVLMALLIYYVILSLFFIFAVAETPAYDSYNVTINLNDTGITAAETDTGGFFSAGVSFLRFAGFVGLGIGLPSDTPSFVTVPFVIWQSLMLIFTIGFVISSVWNG